jgi:hypothetical protein
MYAIIFCIFNLNAMFYTNFWHYYMFCFHGHMPCSKKIVDFNLLAILLYIFSTRVVKICAHMFLIHVHSSSSIICNFSHSSSSIICNFSLTVKSKCIPFVLIFGYCGHNTPTHYAF